MADLLVPIVLAVIAAAGAYGAARLQMRGEVQSAASNEKAVTKKLSGSIDTTEAETLWAESASMRKELRDEVLGLRTELVAIRASHTSMQGELLLANERLTLVQEHSDRCDKALAELQKEFNAMRARERKGGRPGGGHSSEG